MALLSHAGQARLARAGRLSTPQKAMVAVCRPAGSRLTCRAQPETDAGAAPTDATQQQGAPGAPPPAPEAPAPQQPLMLAKGQGTAIVTGAVSIIFGVAYLALVLLLDSRGGEMLPPPPEAFGP
ncbi:MAG: hypothetical protein J3K34DRAFT_87344 [Monoraphidium minutum]|nr:MAG: hypothetical protein J3K34DRAFT_87344 [Monoraphidium minutum]